MLRVIVVFLMVGTLLFGAVGCRSDDDILTPGQVDESMLDSIVKVKGKIVLAVENPMNLGGMYLTLGDDLGEVDVRIQPDIWDGYDKSARNRYEEGKTVTVEGVLVKAGTVLVVVHEKYTSSSNTTDTENSSNR